MRNVNGNGTVGLDAAKAAIIADAALKGASPEGLAVLSAQLGYNVGAAKPAAATAVLATPAWAADALASIGATAAPAKAAKAAKGAERAERTTRQWEGPFDNGVSKAGYPQVMVRTRTATGAPFNLSLPLDAFLAIRNGLLAKPTIG